MNNVNVSGPMQPASTYKTVVLKGNHSFAAQVTEPNTKYVIKHDFDLGGESVTIPENCVLEFDGGSLNGGTITFSNTYLRGNVNISSDIDGSLDNSVIDVTWFGADNTGNVDSIQAIQKCIDLASNSWSTRDSGNRGEKTIYIPVGNYIISSPILIPRTVTLKIKGECFRNTVIKASSSMVSMITAKTPNNSYTQTIIEDITLNGNRTGTYFNTNNDTFNNNSHALADKGIYFPNGYIYSSIKNVMVTNVNDVGIEISVSYGGKIIGCSITNSGYGICLYGASNNIVINDNTVTIIKNYGIVASIQSGGCIENNDIEYCGKAAMWLDRCGNISIANNYIEHPSINGISNLMIPASSVITDIDTIYPCILSIGIVINETNVKTENKIGISTAYGSSYILEGNSFLFNVEHERSCGVFAATLQHAKILSNKINKDYPILGLVRSEAYGYINNVEISNNYTSFDSIRTFAKRIKVLSNKASELNIEIKRNGFVNIYTKDRIENPLFTKELSNLFSFINSGTLTNDKIYGKNIYSASERIVLIATPFNNNGIIPATLSDEEVYEIEYYLMNQDESTFSRVHLTGRTSGVNSFALTIPSGAKYTLPEVRLSSGSYIFGTNNKIDSYGATSIRPKAPQIGFQFFDSTLGKPIWWNGSAWVDATGTPV